MKNPRNKFKILIILIILIIAAAGAGFYIFNQITKIKWSNRSPEKMNWPKAIDYCRNLNEGAHSDWRLPDIDELRTLIKNCPKTEPGGECKWSEKNGILAEKRCFPVDTSCFCEELENSRGYYSRLGDDDLLWSYSTDSFMTTKAWGVYFRKGAVVENDKLSERHNVRCVR